MSEIMCHGRYHEGQRSIKCSKMWTEECPMVTGKLKELSKHPCCLGIWVPAKYLTEAKGDRVKAAKRYVEDVLRRD